MINNNNTDDSKTNTITQSLIKKVDDKLHKEVEEVNNVKEDNLKEEKPNENSEEKKITEKTTSSTIKPFENNITSNNKTKSETMSNSTSEDNRKGIGSNVKELSSETFNNNNNKKKESKEMEEGECKIVNSFVL